MAFASAPDVSAVLGRPLSANETTAVATLLDMATAVLTEAASKDDAWATALNPIPTLFRAYTAQLAARALTNPAGATSSDERLGEYENRVNYANAVGLGMSLETSDILAIRRIVWGNVSETAEADGHGADILTHEIERRGPLAPLGSVDFPLGSHNDDPAYLLGGDTGAF